MDKTAIKGMGTCKVCGRDFPLIIEEHYVSKEPGKLGIVAVVASTESVIWDSFDCTHCGCQNRMQQRYVLTDILGSSLLDEQEDEDPDGEEGE